MAGRPREFDREEALREARDLFWSRGYEGVSMADLVDRLGLASARIYAAFGSKGGLFREAVALYEAGDGGFADQALAEPDIRRAIERVLRDAIELYTRRDRPGGCMVVTAATNCASENQEIAAWLAEHRRRRTASIVDRLRGAREAGQLPPDADPAVLGDFYAALLHGLSVQARDGVSRKRLEAMVPTVMRLLGDPTDRGK